MKAFEEIQKDWENRTLNSHLDADEFPDEDPTEWDCEHQGHEFEAVGHSVTRGARTATPIRCIHCGYKDIEVDEE